MIAGGGTGGHICPGVAIADAIRTEEPGAEVFFMGRSGSIEERVVERSGYPFVAVPSMGLRRGLDARNLGVPFAVLAGYLTAVVRLAGRRPDVAVGTGGFVSLPPIVAAGTLGVPVLLQEQNSYPGLATRVLSRIAESVHASFGGTERHLPRARRVVVSGNPVRRDFATADRAGARESLGLADAGTVVLFLGGSRGARRINEAVAGAGAALRDADIALVVQTGKDDLARVARALREAGARAVVRDFYDNIAEAYAAADLVVSRAGATAISEIAFVGRPSVLVPYPHATEGHQMKNAVAMQEAGAAVVVPDQDFTSERLADVVRGLIEDRERLTSMADAARTVARPDAATQVARAVLALAGGATDAGAPGHLDRGGGGGS